MKKEQIIIWIRGIVSALIGGVSTSITTLIVAPESFNINDSNGIKNLISVAVVSGIVSVAHYLQKSPLPGDCPTIENSGGK